MLPLGTIATLMRGSALLVELRAKCLRFGFGLSGVRLAVLACDQLAARVVAAGLGCAVRNSGGSGNAGASTYCNLIVAVTKTTS